MIFQSYDSRALPASWAQTLAVVMGIVASYFIFRYLLVWLLRQFYTWFIQHHLG